MYFFQINIIVILYLQVWFSFILTFICLIKRPFHNTMILILAHF